MVTIDTDPTVEVKLVNINTQVGQVLATVATVQLNLNFTHACREPACACMFVACSFMKYRDLTRITSVLSLYACTLERHYMSKHVTSTRFVNTLHALNTYTLRVICEKYSSPTCMAYGVFPGHSSAIHRRLSGYWLPYTVRHTQWLALYTDA